MIFGRFKHSNKKNNHNIQNNNRFDIYFKRVKQDEAHQGIKIDDLC